MNGIWVSEPVTRWLLGAGCGESRTSGFEGEVHRSNADIDSNKTVVIINPRAGYARMPA